MDFRPLGRTGLQLSTLSFGASSLGAEFRAVDINEAMRAVHVALDRGMNFIDTSPYYGRGMSEVLLGITLRDVPRDRYLLGTKLGRYDATRFDFSAKRVAESIDVSLHRLGVEYLDICLAHASEYVDLRQIIEETIPAMRYAQEQGKVRFIGMSGYPMKIFREILSQHPLDVILSYNHYTLQNTMLADLVPKLKSRGVGILNAAPFSARLLTRSELPPWHKATPRVRELCRQAAEHCERRGIDIAQLALQFALAHPDLTTCVVGSANPENVKRWAHWATLPIDLTLVAEVRQILAPIHNWFYIEGRPANNDPLPTPLAG